MNLKPKDSLINLKKSKISFNNVSNDPFSKYLKDCEIDKSG